MSSEGRGRTPVERLLGVTGEGRVQSGDQAAMCGVPGHPQTYMHHCPAEKGRSLSRSQGVSGARVSSDQPNREDPVVGTKRPGLCPRRCLEFSSLWSSEPTVTDTWQRREQLAGGLVSWHCNHCGSLHPEEFLDGLRSGLFAIGGTDKGYKWYVDLLVSEEEIARARSRWENSPIGKVLREEAPERLDAIWERDELPHARKSQVSKFYTPHLNRAQAEEIITMWKAGTLNHTMYRQPWLPALAEDAPDWLVSGLGQ